MHLPGRIVAVMLVVLLSGAAHASACLAMRANEDARHMAATTTPADPHPCCKHEPAEQAPAAGEQPCDDCQALASQTLLARQRSMTPYANCPGAAPSGIQQRSTVPRSGSLSTRHQPPASSARSVIVESPR